MRTAIGSRSAMTTLLLTQTPPDDDATDYVAVFPLRVAPWAISDAPRECSKLQVWQGLSSRYAGSYNTCRHPNPRFRCSRTKCRYVEVVRLLTSRGSENPRFLNKTFPRQRDHDAALVGVYEVHAKP
jgi:hypothetical protein